MKVFKKGIQLISVDQIEKTFVWKDYIYETMLEFELSDLCVSTKFCFKQLKFKEIL